MSNKLSVGILPSTPGLRLVSVAQSAYLTGFNSGEGRLGTASFFGLKKIESIAVYPNYKLSGPCHGALKQFNTGLYVIGSSIIRGSWYDNTKEKAQVRAFFDWHINHSVFSAAFDVAVDLGDGSEPCRQTVDTIIENGVWVRTDIDSRIMLGALQGTRYPYGCINIVKLWYTLAIENGIEPALAFYFANLTGYYHNGTLSAYTGDHCPVINTISLDGFRNYLKGVKKSGKSTYADCVNYSYVFDLWSDGEYATNGSLKDGSYVVELLKKYPAVFRSKVVQGVGWASKGPSTFKCLQNIKRTVDDVITIAKLEQEWWNTHLNDETFPVEPYVASRWDGLPFSGGKRERFTVPKYWSLDELRRYLTAMDCFYTIPEPTATTIKGFIDELNAFMDSHPDEWLAGKLKRRSDNY